MRYLAPLALLFLLSTSASAEDARVETWDRIHIGGAPAGTVHTVTRTVTADGATRIETVAKTDIKMKRMGQVTEIQSESVTWETPDGTLQRIATSSKMSAMLTQKVYVFSGTKMTLKTTVMGTTRTTEKEVPADLKGPAFQKRATKDVIRTPGQSVSFTTYVPDFEAVIDTTLTCKGAEAVELLSGRKAELTRMETALGGLPIKPVSWHDASGAPIRTSVNMAGMQIDTYRVGSREEAEGSAGSAPPKPPEVFAQTVLSEDDPIPVPRQLEEAHIVVTKREADAALPEMADAGHTVTQREDGSLLVHARRIVPPAGKGGVRPLVDPPAELADALAANSMIQSDAEEIRKIAQEVAGTEGDAWKTACAFERWVFASVKEKNFNVGFASALEVCRSLEGDCTEHAVLLAALCRAAGIPARVVMGVEYLLGIWGGHAWNEVWIEGTWYPLDATNGYGFVDPLHLPMARMTLKEGAGSEFVGVIAGLGKIDLDIVSVVRDGRTIPVSESAILVTTKDGVYRNPIWGIQFTAPPGYAFDPPTPKGMRLRLMELDGTTASGEKVEIEIDAIDAAPGGGLAASLKPMRIEADEKGTVDGRPSLGTTWTRNGRTQRTVAVVADKALYIFTLDRAVGEAERKAFDAFLASVDFDVR